MKGGHDGNVTTITTSISSSAATAATNTLGSTDDNNVKSRHCSVYPVPSKAGSFTAVLSFRRHGCFLFYNCQVSN
jgi:hypothetical protein